jgi:PilZ domain
MRRLRVRQPVRLDLDTDDDPIECEVASVLGPVATLIPGEVNPDLRARLTPGLLTFMVFHHHGVMVALRGVARAASAGEALEFIVIDGVQVAERRTTARLQVCARVRITDAGCDGSADACTYETHTADLSLGGALVVSCPGLGSGPQWEIELLLEDGAPPIRCHATVARRTPTHVGVAFGDMEDADRIRLAGVLADYRPADRRRAA